MNPSKHSRVSRTTRREKLLVFGAQAYSLRRKGYSVSSISAGLGCSVDFIYRGLLAVSPENKSQSAAQSTRDATH